MKVDVLRIEVLAPNEGGGYIVPKPCVHLSPKGGDHKLYLLISQLH
jgi:hypothetical protein